MSNIFQALMNKPADNPGVMVYRNTCRVKVPEKVSMPDNPDGACGYQFGNHPFAVPILGQAPEKRAIEVIQQMGKHLAAHHSQHLQAALMGSEVMKAFMIAIAFQIEDPNAQQYLSQMRLQLLMGLQRPYIPDADIRQKVAEIGNLTPENVFRLMAQMRDILCETVPQKEVSPILAP